MLRLKGEPSSPWAFNTLVDGVDDAAAANEVFDRASEDDCDNVADILGMALAALEGRITVSSSTYQDNTAPIQ
jgi:hypothetical protein